MIRASTSNTGASKFSLAARRELANEQARLDQEGELKDVPDLEDIDGTAIDALLADLMAELGRRYAPEQVDSILMHEVVHWLRLMPYKLARDRKRAPMFYAGLVMVANDAAAHAALPTLAASPSRLARMNRLPCTSP